jgi:alpha-tubulin suppressor-like RCC1 family protein
LFSGVGFFMALDTTLSNEQKVTALAASNTFTAKYLSDQHVYKLGTNRRSEVLKKIGDTGEPFEKRYFDYIGSL